LTAQEGNKFKLFFDRELSNFCTTIKNELLDIKAKTESQEHNSLTQIVVRGGRNQIFLLF
jgi:hypothetical protein